LVRHFSEENRLKELEKGDLRFLSAFLVFWLPVLGYVTLIFAVSSVSNLPGPKFFPYADKAAHLVEYGILGFLVGRALRGAAPHFVTRFWFALAIIAGVAVGMLDEMFQSRVPGRESSLLDFAADVAGTLVGLVVLVKGRVWWKKSEK
jgi:VanZ family protein